MGGGLFHDDWTEKKQDAGEASTSDVLVYSPGRVNPRAPLHYIEHTFHNTTLALVGGGVAGWMFRSDATEIDGLEIHDFMDQPAFVLLKVWSLSHDVLAVLATFPLFRGVCYFPACVPLRNTRR